jgi:ABC-type maltose transport system permease subunit
MAKLNKKSKIRESFGDRVFDVITSILLILVIVIIGYPVIYVVSCSFSSSMSLQAGEVIL